MIERLSIPAWNTPPTELDAWLQALRDQGHEPRVVREDGAPWIEIPAMRLRGFVMTEGQAIEAIHFELHDRDHGPALTLIETAANAIGWEIHDETDDDDD